MNEWATVTCDGQPHCRHECGFVVFEDRFYLFGGRRIQPVDIFDPVTKKWTSASEPPLEIHHFQPVVVGSEIWMIGTMTGEFPRETPLENVFIYVPATDTWKTGPAIPMARRRGAAGCVLHDDGWIYVVGGIVDGHHAGTQAWFDRLNPVTGTWEVLPDAPNRRDHAPCAVLDGKLYFFGGRETGRHNGTDYDAFFADTVADVDVYDFAAGQWSIHQQPLPIETAAGGAGVHGGKIYYVGGEAYRAEAFSEMQIFDGAADQWGLGAPLDRARHGTNCCVHNHKLWIAAGSGARGGEPELDDIACVDLT